MPKRTPEQREHMSQAMKAHHAQRRQRLVKPDDYDMVLESVIVAVLNKYLQAFLFVLNKTHK